MKSLSLSRKVIAEVERGVVGKRPLLEMVMVTALAGGHVLFEDFPGLGKTLIARSFATALGLGFKRIQFTPDLLPGDITGGYVFNRTKNTFELRKGPVFTNILLADEINRASPKTQSALLEAMQEGQVTIEGESLHAARAVHRARHAEPDRIRRHLPAARGAARSLHGEALRRLSKHGGGEGDPAPAAHARAG